MGLAQIVWRDQAEGKLTPQTVAAVAALLQQNDEGMPISPAAHHVLWLRLITDPDIDKLLIIAPPEAAKTTWVMSFLAAYVGFYPENSVIISSVNASIATKRSNTLRAMTESEIWRSLFPDRLPAKGMPYEQHEWSLAPGGKPTTGRLHPTIRAYGAGEGITGSRADLLIADDLIDFNIARSPAQRMSLREWFYNSFLSRRKVQGRTIVVGTMWNAADLYADIRRSNDGWVICHTPLYSEIEDGFYANLVYPDDFKGQMLGDLCQ